MELKQLQDEYFKAHELAEKYHSGQLDIGCHPYIDHVVYVAKNAKEYLQSDNIQDCYTAMTAGVLHDIIEDCGLTKSELMSAGISLCVIDIVQKLTHDKKVPYADYIINIKKDNIARAVKLADLSNNMDIRRLNKFDNNAIRRLKKYFYSYKFLMDEINEKTYKRELTKIYKV